MKQSRTWMNIFARTAVAAAIGLALAGTASAQRNKVWSGWEQLVRTPSVSGHEEALAKRIKQSLNGYETKTDNLGNVIVSVGSGSPHRLFVAPMDQPGYVVSGITNEGYLRVQTLPQAAPNPSFDALHFAQPIVVTTRAGKIVRGVFGGLSVHLQPGRQG